MARPRGFAEPAEIPIGSLKKISRRTAGGNCALWRNVLMPIARHQPVEPSARAISSMTCRVVRMSAPSPPSDSGKATLNSRAFAICKIRSAGSCRAVSISAARSRMRGARARAIANGVVASGTVSVIIDMPAHPAPGAGMPSRRRVQRQQAAGATRLVPLRADDEPLEERREDLVDRGAGPHLPERRLLKRAPVPDESLPLLLAILPRRRHSQPPGRLRLAVDRRKLEVGVEDLERLREKHHGRDGLKGLLLAV